MKKYLPVFILVTIFTLVLGAFLYSRTVGQKQLPTAPPPIPSPPQASEITPLPIEPVLPTQKNISFTFSFTPPTIPKELPLFQTSDYSALLPQTKTVASSLGFFGDPTTTSSGGNLFYEWSKPNATFTAQDNPRSISLLQEITPGTAPNPTQAQKDVGNFLQRYNLLPPNVQLLLTDSSFFINQGLNLLPSRASSATLISVSYQYSVNTYPIYQSSGLEAGVTSILSSGSSIRSISIFLLPPFQPIATAQLLPLEQAIIALQNNKGVLVRVENAIEAEASATDASFTSVNITNVSLAYVIFPKDKIIKPIYVFSGTGQGGGAAYHGGKIVYFLAATK